MVFSNPILCCSHLRMDGGGAIQGASTLNFVFPFLCSFSHGMPWRRTTATVIFLSMLGLGSAVAAESVSFSIEGCETVYQWCERAPRAPDVLVYGVRYKPVDGGAPFDRYYDVTGQVLSAEELTQYGVAEKSWNAAVVQPSEIVPGFPQTKKSVVAPMRFDALPLEERIVPPVDTLAVQAEDALRYTDAKEAIAERIGVCQPLHVSVEVQCMQANAGTWTMLEEGIAVWRLALCSYDARGIRVHFSRMNLPDGVQVHMYNTAYPSEYYGPFAGEADFWTPTCFGESVVLECVVAAPDRASSLDFEVDQIAHLYKVPDALMKSSAGYCNLDVACYPEWSTTALGVGGIGSIGVDGVLWCTGTLLADQDPESNVPYFLTAYHCMSGSTNAVAISTAKTIEVYWLYQRSACDGEVPAPATVPRTLGGANFLAGSDHDTGTDFAFLRLRNDPPAGLVWCGYDSTAAAVGDAVVDIHHPKGDYKRISFGDITNTGSPYYGHRDMYPIARFHEVLWEEGTTESGSSGSPLFLENSQLIIGQLYGGRASCYATDEPDYFGRFDTTYPIIASWLPPADNPYDLDENGTVNAADLQLLINTVLGVDTLEKADVDQSGKIDAVDVQLMLNTLLKTTQ